MAGELFHFFTSDQDWRYTSARTDQTALSETWTAAPIRRGRWRGRLKDTDFRVTMPHDLQPAPLYVIGNPTTPVQLQVRSLDGATLKFNGVIVNAPFDAHKHEAQFLAVSLSSQTQGATPRHSTGPSCDWILFEPDTCALSTSGFLVTIAVADGGLSINSDRTQITHADIGAKPDGYFTQGKVVSASENVLIIDHVGNTATLLNPLADPALGTDYVFFPGCDGVIETCETKFSNLENFSGFPYTPAKNPVTEGV